MTLLSIPSLFLHDERYFSECSRVLLQSKVHRIGRFSMIISQKKLVKMTQFFCEFVDESKTWFNGSNVFIACHAFYFHLCRILVSTIKL